jgi:hypothetical protein
VIAGVGFALAMSAEGRAPGPNEHNPHREQARARASEMAELVESLDAKSAKAKIEDAYDGAVRTHELGFPASRTR